MHELSPILLIPPRPQPEDPRVHLPKDQDNLFQRLIRDPTAPNRPARETRCAEMLCSVLLNCTGLQKNIFQWLAEMAGVPLTVIEGLDWKMDTEQQIGAKRDDLRIEGWQLNEEESHRVILWTVEIKVAASIHLSSLQTFDDDGEIDVDEVDSVLVSQILNYDHWLALQKADHRCGFVLAITLADDDLPQGLSQPWHCFTWAELAREVELSLANDLLPSREQAWAEHMAGFIRNDLWSSVGMTDQRLEFDDLALIRAFDRMREETNDRIKNLVSILQESLQDSSLITGSVRPERAARGVFGQYRRSVCLGEIIRSSEKTSGVILFAGIGAAQQETSLLIGIQSKPTDLLKPVVRKVVKRLESELIELNPSWQLESEESRLWQDIHLSEDLTKLLATDDQVVALKQFVAKAIQDLQAVGLVEMLEDEIQQLGDFS